MKETNLEKILQKNDFGLQLFYNTGEFWLKKYKKWFF